MVFVGVACVDDFFDEGGDDVGALGVEVIAWSVEVYGQEVDHV